MLGRIKSFLFTNTSLRQTAAKNLFWLSAGQIGSRIIRAFVIIYAARILGASEYGVLSYVLSLAGFFSVFADMGVNSILTRETAKKPEDAPVYFATSFWIKAAMLAVTVLLVIFVAPHLSSIEAAKAIIPFVALLAVFDGFREFSGSFLRGKQRMELEALITFVMNVSIAFFGFVILQTYPTAGALALTYALAAVAGTLAGGAVLRKEFGGIFRNFRIDLILPTLKSALPLSLVTIIGFLMLQIDILMLGYFKEARDVGLYSAGQRIIQFFYIIPAILANAFFPLFARAVGEGNRALVRTLNERLLSLSFLLTVPAALGGALLGDQIISLFYGAEYLPGTLPFQILVFTIPVISMGTIIGNYILAHDEQKRLAPNTIIGATANVVLNVLLIPPYGIVGAAFATITAQLLYNGLNWHFAKHINDFRVFRHLPKILSASAGMCAAAYAMKIFGVPVIMNIIASSLAYAALLFLLREPLIKDVRALFKNAAASNSPETQV